MPAYRSEAENEIRQYVVDVIRALRPDSRVIHEINACGHGSNRIDVMAVGKDEIICFEIKSKRDKLDRLTEQMRAMHSVATQGMAFGVLHRKFFEHEIISPDSYPLPSLAVGEDVVRLYLPEPFQRDTAIQRYDIWAWPRLSEKEALDLAIINVRLDDYLTRKLPPYQPFQALPESAINVLWREELREMCGMHRIPATTKSRMEDMIKAIKWHMTGQEITKAICRALRRRDCKEADEPIID